MGKQHQLSILIKKIRRDVEVGEKLGEASARREALAAQVEEHCLSLRELLASPEVKLPDGAILPLKALVALVKRLDLGDYMFTQEEFVTVCDARYTDKD